MKLVLMTVLLVASANAQAMNLFCKAGKTPAECAAKVEVALEKMGCKVDLSQTNCTYSLKEDPKKPGSTVVSNTAYCEIKADNCSSPRVGNFGGETCDKGVKKQISRAEGVTQGYWFGVFGAYSRTICYQP